MSMMFPAGIQPLAAPEAIQVSLSHQGIHYPTMHEVKGEQPKVSITGDVRLCVTESETALRPIVGRYSIETVGMQEALHTLWHAEGRVMHRNAPATNVAFDLRGARAGETHTYLVAAQVTEYDGPHCIVSGVFVQILVV